MKLNVFRTLYCQDRRWRQWLTFDFDKLKMHVVISRISTKRSIIYEPIEGKKVNSNTEEQKKKKGKKNIERAG